MQRYQYSCNYCHHFVETRGPWPYFREEKKRQSEGGNFSAAPESVRGLKAVIYCKSDIHTDGVYLNVG